MKWFRHFAGLSLVMVMAVIAIFSGVNRGDLYTPCRSDGDPDGGLVQALIICGWVAPMLVVTYLTAIWAGRTGPRT